MCMLVSKFVYRYQDMLSNSSSITAMPIDTFHSTRIADIAIVILALYLYRSHSRYKCEKSLPLEIMYYLVYVSYTDSIAFPL